MEELVVTGIRGSLTQSMDVKRDAKGVVDAISAEDMGKFPDSNLAESLQRVTGVSINRRNGEGNQVTVRGFGPDYNLVTLNGRLMPATSLTQNGGGVQQGRAFDMDNLAAESVRALEVYKSSRADIASGGMGATINIKTLRPLDNPGTKASFGVKTLNDTTARVGDDFTPEASGVFSWTDETDTFGVSLTGSYQDRNSGASGAYINNWNVAAYDGSIPQSPGAGSGDPINIENAPAVGDLRSLHTDLRYIHSDRERTRVNSQLTLQWRPADNLTGTVDYTYAKQDIYENRAELSAWMDTYKSDLVFDDAVVSTPVLYWEERREQNPRDVGLALQQQNQQNKLESVGLNLEWQPNEQLDLAFDAHKSESSSLPSASFGNWINIGLGANVSAGQGIDFTKSGLPVLMLDFDDSVAGNGNGVLDKEEIGSTVRQISNDRAYSDFTQVRFDGTFTLDDQHSIDFGIESRDMEQNLQSSFYQELLAGGWGVANPGDVPDEYLQPLNYASLFDGYSVNPTGEAGEFFDRVSDGEAAPLMNGYIGDAAVIGKHLSEAVGLPWAVNPTDNLNRTIEEKVFAAYAQYNYSGEFYNKPIDVVFGLRHERTDVSSTDLANIPTDVVWQSNNDFQIPAGAVASLYAEEAEYDHWLPNLDVKMDLSEDLVGRFSYSQSIARSRFDNMGSAATGLSGPSSPTNLSGSILGGAGAGNPGILPLESDNYDLSVEWYYGESSYASIGYFRKDVDNFIGTSAVDMNLYGLTDPTSGPREQQAVADLAALGEPLNDTTLFSMVAANMLGVSFYDYTAEEFENLVDVTGNPEDDLMIFRVSRPMNTEKATIDGWEMGVQHFFGETGFGAQANYTIVDGDVGYDVGRDPDIDGGAQFALSGLSDTANLSLIYENHGISARIAYNWRDTFLSGIEDGGKRPRFIEDYSQVDLSVGYEVNDNLKLAFEGVNLLGEDSREYARTKAQLLRTEMLGPRYALSARYSF
ncbi:TonB-dependent receptor [Microbulbifer salipaludis]|uniref:TonB-dependent receptor n=1 Tax=Microbulbifer salipaludis TaxID=187980 RepID=A0ABS3E6S0_9GAMM|nr:TonB-dependent receptor [Microbulbifer salipaludis]MBN8430981.1 TonB-dependent receptor [Microbulbifer salipaludis]